MNTKNSKSTNANNSYSSGYMKKNIPGANMSPKTKFKWKLMFSLLMLVTFFGTVFMFTQKEPKPLVSGSASSESSIWKIRSVDTMKVSRDKAREYNVPLYEPIIKKEVELIRNLGANYIAIGTPYDDEFLPYLKKWVKYGRDNNLSIWYRGSFANYEGWFGYEKNMSPDQLLNRTEQFIVKNPDLFRDGDIFDPCPECENGNFWPQPQEDQNYNLFVQRKNLVLKNSFTKINKKVIYNLNSIIGGRAKDVVDQATFDALGNVVAIDHYAKDLKSYTEYINYFAKDHRTKLVFAELGAPIPDLHGNMSEEKQAEFIESVFNELYLNSNDVQGINYWVLTDGTTALYDKDYKRRKIADVVEKYYKPAVIEGFVIDTLKDPVPNASIKVAGTTKMVKSDNNGYYRLIVPSGDYELLFEALGFNPVTQKVSVQMLDKRSNQITLIPIRQDLWYRLRQLF